MKKVILQLAVAAVFTCAPSLYGAFAGQQLQICSGLNCIFVNQDGTFTTTGTATINSGNISVLGTGQIAVTSNAGGLVTIGPGGQFLINSASAFGRASSIPPQLQDLISLSTTSTGSGTLMFEYTDNSYHNLGTGLLLSGSESTVNTPGTSVTFSAFGANSALATPPATTLIGALGPITGLSSSAAGTFANPFTGANATLSSMSTIVFSGAGSFNTTFDIATAVPEPASVLMLGTVLLGLTGLVRKKVARRS